MTSKTALILATTAAIALASFDLRPAAAAPEGGPAIVKQNAGADEFSAQRKRRRGRGVNPAVPLAAFGALIGTIGAVAAARRERDVLLRTSVLRAGYGYYAGPPAYQYAQPQPYVRHHYAPPRVSRVITRRGRYARLIRRRVPARSAAGRSPATYASQSAASPIGPGDGRM